MKVASPPLQPRSVGVVARIGTTVVAIGGAGPSSCPPNADCAEDKTEYYRDGAAFDVEKGTWRRIADAPRDIRPGAAAVLGDSAYMTSDGQLLSYDLSSDRWLVRVRMPEGFDYAQLVPFDGHIVAVRGERAAVTAVDEQFDPATGTWTALPEDPLGPSFGRSAVSTPAGLVLTGMELVPNPGSEKPAVERAAVLDAGTSTWRRLPDSDMLGGGAWTWTGRRLVDPALGGADGGEVNNWGRVVPNGGTLDPVAGRWGRLPDAPQEGTGGWSLGAYDGGPLIATGGWLYDDDAGTWTSIPPPEESPELAGPAIWVGHRLLVIGGTDHRDDDWHERFSAGAWMLLVDPD